MVYTHETSVHLSDPVRSNQNYCSSMRLLYLVVDFEKLWNHRRREDCWIELFWTNWMGRVLADTSAHLSKKVAKSGPDSAFVGRICQVNLRRTKIVYCVLLLPTLNSSIVG